jgi:hypothetical protein
MLKPRPAPRGSGFSPSFHIILGPRDAIVHQGGAYATVISDAHPNKTTGTILLTDLYGARDSGLTVNSTLQPALGGGETLSRSTLVDWAQTLVA